MGAALALDMILVRGGQKNVCRNVRVKGGFTVR